LKSKARRGGLSGRKRTKLMQRVKAKRKKDSSPPRRNRRLKGQAWPFRKEYGFGLRDSNLSPLNYFILTLILRHFFTGDRPKYWKLL